MSKSLPRDLVPMLRLLWRTSENPGTASVFQYLPLSLNLHKGRRPFYVESCWASPYLACSSRSASSRSSVTPSLRRALIS